MDEERIRRMTRLAMYAQDGETGRDIEIVKYHKRDYIGAGIVGNIFLITIAYVIMLAAYMILHITEYTENMAGLSIKSILLYVLLLYGVILGLYSVLVFVIRSIRYDLALERAQKYYEELCALGELYDEEDGTGRHPRKNPGGADAGRSGGRRRK